MGGLDPVTKAAISEWFTGEELVSFLGTPVDLLIDLLEEDILDNLTEVLEEINFERQDDE